MNYCQHRLMGWRLPPSLRNVGPFSRSHYSSTYELRRLALQLMATAPKRVKARDRDYRRLDELLSVLHLPEERLTVQCHYFLAHYQAHLLKHGNLQVVSIIVDPVLPLRQYATYYTLYPQHLLYAF